MRYITEQDLQMQNRQEPLKKITLAQNERLTPGARQFLTDHQIVIIECGGQNGTTKEADNTLKTVNLGTKRQTFFPLLELELWEAALKANEINRTSCQRITELAFLAQQIAKENLSELEIFEIAETATSELTSEAIFQPTGKIILKLQRACVYSTTLKTCVTAAQKEALEYLICLIKNEIDQLLV
ncbi:hypothetical protein [Enterococcus dongliensis]|uniref:hypothetical protein n=1 Tax=Enterococcus dongliensis TaxID=2559925 RepID=UPI00288E1DEF|nr:hypothetical protein [Enterococcus dongliensis]MDT2674899.1 hypothetical protein [Enterococcus dongliensis]